MKQVSQESLIRLERPSLVFPRGDLNNQKCLWQADEKLKSPARCEWLIAFPFKEQVVLGTWENSSHDQR
jgi:hypothetical protein